jgi:hypothetical protein
VLLLNVLLIVPHRLRARGASYHQACNASNYKSMLHVVLRYALSLPLLHASAIPTGSLVNGCLEKAIGSELLAAAVAADEYENLSESGVIRQAMGTPD